MHGVFNLEVSSNVAYDNMGHAFFIEVGTRLKRANSMVEAEIVYTTKTPVVPLEALCLSESLVLCLMVNRQKKGMKDVKILHSLVFATESNNLTAPRN